MKKMCALVLALMLPLCALAEAPLPQWDWTFKGTKIAAEYDSPSLKFTVERFEYEGARCYLSKVWMQDPGRQIHKATAEWEKNLGYPSNLAKQLDCKPALVVNGSGYVSPVFPEIPDNYPGKSKDYHFTPLGSITVTNGEVLRHLEGVPFYGLTLQEDGLHMHVGEDPAQVLACNPIQTWSFYVECPIIRDYESILDPEWKFSVKPNIRTVVGKLDDNNYFLLTVTHKTNTGLTMTQVVEFLQENVKPEWAYNLDGGPSSALLARSNGDKKLKTIYGNNSKDADIMAFAELPAEP